MNNLTNVMDNLKNVCVCVCVYECLYIYMHVSVGYPSIQEILQFNALELISLCSLNSV